MRSIYEDYPIKFVAPFRVSLWLEYYDFHELAETARRKCADYAQCREVAAKLKGKYHTGNGVNRVYCEVIDSKGNHVPVQIWQAVPKATAAA